MRRRSASLLTSALSRVYQSNLKALTKATVRGGKRIATQVRRET
ncbi:MAG: hypothetical protein JWQ03_2075, partial [Variovorax sp.]|nr:hypothetical protein [Variovorax sp.]